MKAQQERDGGLESTQGVQKIKIRGTDRIWDGPILRIYEKPAVSYAVESPKGNKAMEIMIEQLTRDELSKIEELDLGKTERRGNFGDTVVRKTPNSGVRITAKARCGRGSYTETKIVTSGKRQDYAVIDVKGTGIPDLGAGAYDGDAIVNYTVMSGKIDTSVEPWEREWTLKVKMEPLTRKELEESKMAEAGGGVRMTISDGKCTETKIVTYSYHG